MNPRPLPFVEVNLSVTVKGETSPDDNCQSSRLIPIVTDKKNIPVRGTLASLALTHLHIVVNVRVETVPRS